jgi:hypothetical protein
MNDIEIEHLKTSISVAWRARENGNHPFGAVLVDEHNQVVLQAENTVVTRWKSLGGRTRSKVCTAMISSWRQRRMKL